ncbi:MAG: amino acid adenylation domain-containing protein [Sandaracinaceae bacterium]|nr:amino acid adenylation domain-containing protein [Myxococcales bacterium]MCB9657089.1 amino acid adenylation domain-containing protein [Sandaracinaceae bacterium]
MQHGMLAETLATPARGVNVQQIVVRLHEALDPDALREAFHLASSRHEALRTSFRWRGRAAPVQVVHRVGPLSFEVVDWRDTDGSTHEVSLGAWLAADRARGVALDATPTTRWTLFRLDEHEWTLVWTFHHALLDGRSFTRVLHEAFEDYAQLARGLRPERPPAPSPREHIEALAQVDRAATEAFFRTRLMGLSEPTRLALGARRVDLDEPQPTHREHEVRLAQGDVERIAQRAAEAGVTFFTCVQAAWAILLARYARRDDVVFGVTRAGRHLVAGAEHMVGCLINTVPQRASVREERPLVELLQALGDASRAVRPFEHAPLVDVQRLSGLPQGEPLLTTNVVLERYLLQSHLRQLDPSWQAREVEVLEQSSFPLSLAAYLDGALVVRLEFDPRVYAAATIEGMAKHLLQLLEDIGHATVIIDPVRRLTQVGEVRTLGDEECARLLRETAPARPTERVVETYAPLFRRVAMAHPERIAVSCHVPPGADARYPDAAPLTYAELDRRSDAIAARLRALGVTREDRVAICLPRTVKMAEALLGVLKAGAAYVPLDPTYPATSLEYMLADSGARALICLSELAPLDTPSTVARLALDLDWGSDADRASDDPRSVHADPGDLAYVIYTSGSTGRPKGVMVEHRSLVAHNRALAREFALTPADRVLQFASFSFDVSMEEMLPTWLAGATLVLRSREMGESLVTFQRAVAEERITVLNLPTAFWHELVRRMDEHDERLPASVRLVIVGGEKASRRAYATWRRVAPGVRWLNGYGPTEASVTCAVYDPMRGPPLHADDDVPIGHATDHARLYVLDRRRRLAPPGVPGELYAAGPCVARGYLGQDALSGARFFDDPFAPGERMYATGDLARWSPTYELEFLGRIDRQVKLRGFRIEPGEVEAVLERHPGVTEAVVGAREDSDGHVRLWAWVTCAPEAPVDERTLRRHVREALPSFMTPSAISVMSAFPLTPGGKVDLSALPVPGTTSAPSRRGAARHATDRRLCALFAEALELPQVAPDQSFYDLGGHSLLAVRLLDRVNESFGVQLTLGVLKAADTPADLADRLLGSVSVSTPETIFPIQPRGTRPPVFAVHVLGSNGSYFGPLSDALGADQPVIGVTSPPRPTALPNDVGDIAAAYARDIMRYTSEGPIALVAVSLGGVVAVEVARQLRAAGRDVEFVGLLDALGPGPVDPLRGIARMRRHAQALTHQGPRYAMDKLSDRSQRLHHHARLLELRVRRALDLGVSDELGALEFVERNVQVALAHSLQPYDGRVTVLRATENVFYSDAYRRGGLGWGDVALAGVEVIDVPGEHLSMLAPPHVGTLARELAAALGRAHASWAG